MASGGRDLGCWFFFSLATCLTLVGFTLPTIHCSSFPPPAYTSYEVVIPRRLAARGKTKKDEISYIIKAAGRDYIIQLKPKKNILVRNFPVFTYSSQGERTESHPYIQTECYHQGYVEGVVDSLVVLRTCSGLSGFLKINDKSYGIEPFQNSSAFQHLLYLSGEPEPVTSPYRLGVEGAEGQTGNQHTVIDNSIPYQRFPRYIELYVVVDRDTFSQEANNISRVLITFLTSVNIIDAIFYSLRTHVILVGMEIWTVKNFINISEDISQVLQNFNAWRLDSKVTKTKYDTAFLVFHQTSSRSFGQSYASSVCSQRFSAGVQLYLKNLIIFTVGFLHELAQHIGLKHDGPDCFCGRYSNCIMHTYHASASQFSNCSIQDITQLEERGELNCLANFPGKLSNAGRCGNGILDFGEQCDCGGEEKCKRDPCCTPDCDLKEHAVCAVGKCCNRCQYLPNGKICRAKASECDLPEYCNGKSAWCPRDLYMQDGTPCNRFLSYCYKKGCLSHDGLCHRIFKGEATAAPLSCFTSLNTQGNLFGNCGSDTTGYLKCQPKDSLCGRLQCANVEVAPVLKDFSVFNVEIDETMCWSIASPVEKHHYDIGAVPDGLMCGPDKVCLNHSCKPITVLTAMCSWKHSCSSRGVCNNLHKCHCNLGWAPPECMSWGAGGSIDGGFPVMTWSTAMFKHVFGTVIPLAVLALAVLTGILSKLGGMAMRWRAQRRASLKVRKGQRTIRS